MVDFMQIAISEANKGIKLKHGGPFGAVIVKNNKIIAKAHNTVLKDKYPVAHAEINAIKKACKKLGTHDLSGCEIYSTCEPCPMCFSALYWAGIKVLYYGCLSKDAEKIGFQDDFIYRDIRKNKNQKIQKKNISRKECLVVFDKWVFNPDKRIY